MHATENERSPSSCSSSCVKLYVCSNPEDSLTERQSLRDHVFPRFTHHCRRSLGLEVRVIDPFESSDPSCWPDENSRQQLIEGCRESSAGPFLLALVGHQYGAASLPTQVEVSEYQLLLQESQQAGVSTQQLETAYQRDENIIPPSYRLKAEVGQVDSMASYDQEEVRKELQSAVSLCVQNKTMTPERARVFHRSALDADLTFALDKRPAQDIISRCVVYVHKVINATEQSLRNSQLHQSLEGETSDQAVLRTAPTQGELLSELCDNFLPALVTSCQLMLYTTRTECDRRHGYTTARRRGYADSLCQQVFSDLLTLTDSRNISLPGADAPIKEEQLELERLCNVLSPFYDIRLPEEDKIRSYVELRSQQHPLVVTGGPCSGKTVLVAHCTQQIQSWLADRDPVVIGYFCSLSIDTTPKHLLSVLCSQIAFRFEVHSLSKTLDPSSNPNSRVTPTSCSSTSVLDSHGDHGHEEHPSKENLNLSVTSHSALKLHHQVCLSELKEHLESLFSLYSSTTRPLILLLDGLDQLEDNRGAQIITSLPSPLPDGVKLIITASPNCTRLLQTIKLHYTDTNHLCGLSDSCERASGYVCVQMEPVDRKQCLKLLESLLKTSGRRVTSGQQALVNQALTSCCLPLYARLLHVHTSLWHSGTKNMFSDGVNLIDIFKLGANKNQTKSNCEVDSVDDLKPELNCLIQSRKLEACSDHVNKLFYIMS